MTTRTDAAHGAYMACNWILTLDDPFILLGSVAHDFAYIAGWKVSR